MQEVLIQFSQKDNIAKIILNRPQSFNSINRETALLFQDILKKCEADDVRAVYLTGAGKAFCAGQDLKEVTDKNLMPGFRTILEEHYNPIIKAITSLEKPVICAVNGVAAGAGANIALACDIVIAKEAASFIQAFSKIGLVPDSGGTYFLPRIIGYQKALALALLGEKVSAKEAEEMGMIYKCVADDDFEDFAWKTAQRLATMPTKGLAMTKRLFQASMRNSLDEQLNLEQEYQIIAGRTEDYHEGVAAFIEKRSPTFRGR